MPTHAPTARPRSSTGNDEVMIASVVGMTKAAPDAHGGTQDDEPRRLRHEERDRRGGAKITRPIIRVSRRPNRSPKHRRTTEARKDHRVGVDDPLEFGLGRPGVEREAREGHIQTRHCWGRP